jgi:5-dehydro-2-deoxygluconokinase
VEDFDAEEVAAAPLLFATGTGLAQEPSRATTLCALRSHTGTTVFDLDWRPVLWDDPALYRAHVLEAAAVADVLVGNEEEVEAAGGLRALRAGDSRVVIVKRGERGASVYERDETSDVPGHAVDVVNGLGAGDAFAAALGHGLIRGLPVVEAVRRGTIAGGIVASQLPCSEAMPRLEELEAKLAT